MPMTQKPVCPNIDNTDTEDDADSDHAATIPTNAGMDHHTVDEWQAYLNAIEDIPAGMRIVYWWGVCDSALLYTCLDGITNVCTL